uniref:TLC domain-containing protein n=1 Tax=Syphacia muris TaxID=451379 RepID=A0A0N5AQ71_9BILA
MSVILEPEYWLPRNVSWSDIPTKSEDLIYPVLISVPMLLFRILFESFVGVPLGYLIGYRQIPLLKQIATHLCFGFASNTHSKRVLECFFRFSFYTALWIYGIYVLWGVPWLTEVKQWYYMTETAFYYSLLIASIFDVRRSDFLQLVFHHIVTIGLLSASWAINFVRVGTLVLLSHDVSDVVLEFSKLVRYNTTGKDYSNVCFVVFVASWILTRIGYFPLVVIRSAVFEAADLIQPDYNLLNIFQIPYAPRTIIIMLICLLALHLFWTRLIIKIAWKAMKSGEAEDVRSDDEDNSDSHEDIKKHGKIRHRKKAD